MGMNFLCWLLRHKLRRIQRSRIGGLDKVYCSRCKTFFAMHHPTKWFGQWDSEDDEAMKELN